MRVLGVVQARMGSTRLPKKAMLPLAGVSMTVAVVRRVQMAQTMPLVVAAIPETRENDVLDEELCGADIAVVRGPEADLWSRYLTVLAHYQEVEAIVRVTGDEPLVDPDAIDRVVSTWLLEPSRDFVHNCWGERTWPDGSDVELVTARALRKEAEMFTGRFAQAHQYNGCLVRRPGENLGGLQWSVDTDHQYQGAQRVYEECGPRVTTDQIIRRYGIRSIELLRRY